MRLSFQNAKRLILEWLENLYSVTLCIKTYFKKAFMNPNIDLLASCYGKVKDVKYDIAILPWGATEPHNYHLPYLTDCILSHDIAVESAEKAWCSGVHTMVRPPVFLGSQNPGQRDLPFCIHGRYETQKAILSDVVASLQIQGINKMLIVNGHGGNNFKNMIRDLNIDYPDFVIAVSEWYKVVPAKDYFEEPGDHADELETSVMMFYHPEYVNIEDAGEGTYRSFAISSLSEGVAWIPRDWSKISMDTGVGNPKKATAEKGRRFATAVTDKYAFLLRELAFDSIY